MKRGLSLFLVLAAVTGCLAGPEDPAAPRIQWVKDLPVGLRQARESGRPIMLFFSADWCAPCLQLKKYVFSDKRVVGASQRLVNVYIDTDANPELVTAYGIRGIPAIFFLHPDGQLIGKFSGDPTVSNFVKQMAAIADKHTR
jgi:protein disulfide-isomerase